MSKMLVLSSRVDGNWHDSAILGNVLTVIAQNKPIGKAAMWMGIAGRVEVAREENTETVIEKGKPDRTVIDMFSVELKNVEAKLLWREIQKLKPVQFGRNPMSGAPSAPPLGILYTMLVDWATCLEEKMPEPDEEEDD